MPAKLAQARDLKLTLARPIACQVLALPDRSESHTRPNRMLCHSQFDGEPFLQQPCMIHIFRLEQARLLAARH